jgi:hypothetical protein
MTKIKKCIFFSLVGNWKFFFFGPQMSPFFSCVSFLIVAHVSRIQATCYVFNNHTTLTTGMTNASVCVGGLLFDDNARSFVTHSWTGPFTTPASYAIEASLVFNISGCQRVQLTRTTADSEIAVSWSVVACRDGEITNVWRKTLGSSHLRMTANYTHVTSGSDDALSIGQFVDNSLVLGSHAVGSGMYFNADDVACVSLNRTANTVSASFASASGASYPNLHNHFQLVKWNPTTATVASSLTMQPVKETVAFGTACATAFAEPDSDTFDWNQVALRFNMTTGQLSAPSSALKFSGQYLTFQNGSININITEIFIGAGMASGTARTAAKRNFTWPIILGTSNMFGIPRNSTNFIHEVHVSVGFEGSNVVARRHNVTADLTVFVAVVMFPSPAPTSAPTSQTSPTTTKPSTSTSTLGSSVSMTSTSNTSGTAPSESETTSTSKSMASTNQTPVSVTTTGTVNSTPGFSGTVMGEEDKANKKRAAAVGGGVGGGAVLLFIIAGAVCCACRARTSKSSESQTATPLTTLNANNETAVQNSNSVRESNPKSNYGAAPKMSYSDVADAPAYGDVRALESYSLGDMQHTTQQISSEYSDVSDVRATVGE